MNWGWRKIDAKNYRLDDTWAVQQDWVTNEWYVVKNGKHMLVNYPDCAGAMGAAERLRKEAK